MRQQWWGVAAALAALASTGAADDGRAIAVKAPVALVYDAPDVCAGAELVRDEVTTRAPGAQFAADGGVLAIARIADTRDGYVGELIVVPPGGIAGAPRLFRPMATCEEAGLAIAAELAAYVAGLPPAVLAPGEEPPPPPRARPIGRFEVGGGGELGIGDEPSPVLALGYLMARGPWWAGGEVRLQQYVKVIDPDSFAPTELSTLDVLGLAHVCREFAFVQTCATAGIGWRRVSEEHRYGRSFEDSGGFGAVGVRIGLRVPLGRTVALEPWVEAARYAGALRPYGLDVLLGDNDVSVVVGASVTIDRMPTAANSKPPP